MRDLCGLVIIRVDKDERQDTSPEDKVSVPEEVKPDINITRYFCLSVPIVPFHFGAD